MAKRITSGKPRGKPFKPGASPNPGGVPKGEASPRRIDMDARPLTRDHSLEAVKKLISIMNNPEATHTAQLDRRRRILDRGYGRPAPVWEVYGSDVQADSGDDVLETIEVRLVELGQRLRAQGLLPRLNRPGNASATVRVELLG